MRSADLEVAAERLADDIGVRWCCQRRHVRRAPGRSSGSRRTGSDSAGPEPHGRPSWPAGGALAMSRPSSACSAIRPSTSSVSSTPALDRPRDFLFRHRCLPHRGGTARTSQAAFALHGSRSRSRRHASPTRLRACSLLGPAPGTTPCRRLALRRPVAWSTACTMSSSATPCLRAEAKISTCRISYRETRASAPEHAESPRGAETSVDLVRAPRHSAHTPDHTAATDWSR